MKPLLIAFFLIGLTPLTFSCKQTNTATLAYERLNYDTNRIAIFKWDTTKYQFPANSDPLPLTQEDLEIADSLLKDAVDSFNMQISPRMYQLFDSKVPLDSFIIKQEKYKYQYFPSKDVNGQRVMTIIGFSTGFEQWKKEVYQPRLHYGMRMLELKVNLSEKTRDNIRSGDFG
jgi:hypothetical protein